MMDIYSQAPTAQKAEILANAVVDELRAYLADVAVAQRTPEADQIRLVQLGRANGEVINDGDRVAGGPAGFRAHILVCMRNRDPVLACEGGMADGGALRAGSQRLIGLGHGFLGLPAGALAATNLRLARGRVGNRGGRQVRGGHRGRPCARRGSCAARHPAVAAHQRGPCPGGEPAVEGESAVPAPGHRAGEAATRSRGGDSRAAARRGRLGPGHADSAGLPAPGSGRGRGQPRRGLSAVRSTATP